MPKTAIGYINNIGLDFTQRFVTKAPPIQYAISKIFGYCVGYTNQLSKNIFCALSSEIEGDPQLAYIVIVESAPLSIPRRSSLNGCMPRSMSQRPACTGSSP